MKNNLFEFTYWDNSVTAPKLLFQMLAKDILDADDVLLKQLGIDVMKKPAIGCQVKVVDTLSI